MACLALLLAFVLPTLTPPQGRAPAQPRPERSKAPPTLTGPAKEGSNGGDVSESGASTTDSAIHVQVVAKDRLEPLARVRLRFGSERSHDEAASSAEEMTGPDGLATFRGHASGFVTVTDPEWMTDRGIVCVSAGRPNVLEVQRRRNMSVCLRTLEGGGGVPGWSVSPLGLGTGVATTGPDGTALLARQEFPPRILVIWDGRAFLHGYVLHRYSTADLWLDVPAPELETRLLVTDDRGSPLAGAEVRVGSEASDIFLRTDAQGGVAIEYARPALRVVVSAPSHYPTEALLQGESRTTAVLQRAGSLTVTADRRIGGDLEDGARLQLQVHRPADDGLGARPRWLQGVWVGGRARIEGVPVSAFDATLRVRSKSAWSVRQVHVPAGDERVLAVGFLPPTRYRFTVYRQAPDGGSPTPMEDVLLVRFADDESCPDSMRGVLDQLVGMGDGSIQLRPAETLWVRKGPALDLDLPAVDVPGCLWVGAVGAGARAVPIDGEGPRAAVDIVLTPELGAVPPLFLRVVRPDGRPASLEFFALRAWEDGKEYVGSADSTGMAVLAGVPAGRYSLRTIVQGGPPYEAEVEVTRDDRSRSQLVRLQDAPVRRQPPAR